MISAIIGCTSSSKEAIVSNPVYLEGFWSLASILQDTSGIKKGLSAEWPYININKNKKTINGYSGCNSFGGDFILKSDSLKFGPLTATQRGCLTSVEPALFAQLRRVNRYWVNKDSLKFFAQDTLLLSFARNQTF